MSTATSLEQGYRGSEQSLLMASRFYRANNARRAVMHFHPAGGLAASPLDSVVDDVPLAIAERFPLCSFDYGDKTVASGTTSAALSWGNDNALTSAASAKTFMQTAGSNGAVASGYGGATDKFHIYAVSMGALVALNYLVSLATPASVCASVALCVPVLDLDDVYQNNKGSWQASIAAAYGVSFPTAITGLATHSPAAYSGANLAKLTMPIRIWASSSDAVASDTAHALTWAASVPNATVTDLGAVVHANAPAAVVPSQVVAFFEAN